MRLQYQSGAYDKVIAEYKKGEKEIPEEVRAEMMLIVGNSHRQLGHTKEADEIYRQLIEKYPSKEEAKDAQYQRLINFYNTNTPTLLDEIDAYLKLSEAKRRAYLDKTLAGKHPEPGGEWKTARRIAQLEWFASSDDLCRAMATIRAPLPCNGPREPHQAKVRQHGPVGEGLLLVPQALRHVCLNAIVSGIVAVKLQSTVYQ